uniref:SFRICE_007866 n=1 Tax=Spodoptera frugiperda TaxID=7108 RepID=A0A2H1VFM0_SPOFR
MCDSEVFLQNLITFNNVDSGEGQEHGPVFLMEPPPRLVFSNTTGARASCAAHGFPSPQIAWQQPDGQQLDDVPGLSPLPFPTPNPSRSFIQYQETRHSGTPALLSKSK